MTNAMIYHRVARRPDADPSPDEQRARILAYAESMGWASVAEYIDDTRGGDAE